MSNTDYVQPSLTKKKLGRPPRITESQINDIVSSYPTCTAKELASKHNLSKRYILEIWSRHGLKGKSRRKYEIDLDYFEKIDSPDKAYFLGFIAADGCVRKPSHGPLVLSIRISSTDEEILIKFLKHLRSDIPIHHSPYTTPRNRVVKEASFVYVIGDKICEDLAKHNIVQRKTQVYNPTPLPDNLMPHFTRGYFDGDGTIYKIGARGGNAPSDYRLAISVNEKTGRFFLRYFEGKNIRSSLVEDKGSSLFQLRINDNLSKRHFIDLLYEDSGSLFLTRKKALIDKLATCLNRQEKQVIYI